MCKMAKQKELMSKLLEDANTPFGENHLQYILRLKAEGKEQKNSDRVEGDKTENQPKQNELVDAVDTMSRKVKIINMCFMHPINIYGVDGNFIFFGDKHGSTSCAALQERFVKFTKNMPKYEGLHDKNLKPNTFIASYDNAYYVYVMHKYTYYKLIKLTWDEAMYFAIVDYFQ